MGRSYLFIGITLILFAIATECAASKQFVSAFGLFVGALCAWLAGLFLVMLKDLENFCANEKHNTQKPMNETRVG
jgi:uncharacterized membrane protein